MTVAPGKIKVQNKHDLIQRIAFYVFNTHLESSASITQNPKE